MTTFTAEQENALKRFAQFVGGSSRCMLLKGYAGTGKTFLIGHMAGLLADRKRGVVLLAPTGRAARVITEKTGIQAQTIHRHIYNLNDLVEHDDLNARFKFYFQLKASTQDEMRNVIIVDESSMISDRESDGEFIRFGSGRLLYDLIKYTRLQEPNQETKIVFVGDDAQLTPVNMDTSPALDQQYLSDKFQLKAVENELTEVVRQAASSKVLEAATAIRENIRAKRFNQLVIKEAPPEITATDSTDVAKRWKAAYQNTLPPSFIVITHSNDTALRYNLLTRAALWGGKGDEPVRAGDFLMIIANNRATGLLNGDLALVLNAEKRPEVARVSFRVTGGTESVELKFRGVEIEYETVNKTKAKQKVRILENVLHSNRPDISPGEQRALYVHFKSRNRGLNPNTKAFTQAISEDLYFNALRVKYGYAGTCHKAQGGEWPGAVVIFESLGTHLDAQRWAYTAITRAKKHLFGFNLPHVTIGGSVFDIPVNDNQENTDANQTAASFTSQPTKSNVVLDDAYQLPPTTPDFVRDKHRKATELWPIQGIQIKGFVQRIAHHYLEYRLAKNDREVLLMLYFDRNENFNPQFRTVHDPDGELALLVSDLLNSIQADISFPEDKPFLKDFYEQEVAPRAKAAGFKITNLKHNSWVERYTFFNQTKGTAIMDFSYNGRGCITNKMLISGPDPFLAV